MYGWRGRIGAIVPSSNTVCEAEFMRMIPEGVSLHTARVFNPRVQREEDKEGAELAMNAEVDRAARELASVEPQVVIYANTTGSFIKGLGYDRELGERIRKAAGVPGVPTASAAVEALKAFHLQRIVLITPYILKVGGIEKNFFENSVPGLKVLREKHLGNLNALEIGHLTPYDAYRAAREMDVSEADGFFISCTTFHSADIIEPLEADTGKPVLTSNQASMWMALKMIGVSGGKGFGKLFMK